MRRPRGLSSRVAALEREIAELRPKATPGTEQLVAERDDLRATVVSLEEALVRMRAASEFEREAAAARADVIAHLLAASAANESAEALHQKAIAELEEAVAGATRPGHLGQA